MCTRAINRDIADTLCVKRLFTERAAPDLHAVIACPAVQQWRHRPAQRVEASGGVSNIHYNSLGRNK